MVKVNALIGKEWNSVTWDGDVWEHLMTLRTLNPQMLKGLTSPEEVVPSALPLKNAFLSPLTKEINSSLSARPAVVFCEENFGIDYIDVSQGPPIVALRQSGFLEGREKMKSKKRCYQRAQ